MKVLKVFAILWLLTACHSEADYIKDCAKFGNEVERQVKYARGACWVHCPESTGWITDWMWRERGGCGANPK